MNLSNLLKHSHLDSRLRNGKMATLPVITCLTFFNLMIFVPLFSASPVQLFYPPIAHLHAKIGDLDPSNNRNRSLKISHTAGASSHCAPQRLLIHGGFPFLANVF